MEHKPLSCSIKPPLHIKVGDHKLDFHSGCSVIDVLFPNVFYVEIGEIVFKNYNTANITIKAKKKLPSGEGDSKWTTCLSRFSLMPDPHTDQGSEDYFTIASKQLTSPLQNITALRFILRQPSPLWKEFRLEDIRLYKTSLESASDVGLPTWLNKETENEDRALKGMPPMQSLSRDLQNMWAMTNSVTSSQNKGQLGRYDVEGSYEINLLSYT